MAVSKRTRYEVLRRDNHTCRYCHATDTPLTVDHVTPVTLGGSDDPSNLVAACKDCNAGKASTNPTAPMVADVAGDALRWAAAMQRVAQARAVESQKVAAYIDAFGECWGNWTYGRNCYAIPLPTNWENKVTRFYELGVSTEELQRCARIALGNERVSAEDTFRYFAGCAWRVVTELQEAARLLLDAEDVT